MSLVKSIIQNESSRTLVLENQKVIAEAINKVIGKTSLEIEKYVYSNLNEFVIPNDSAQTYANIVAFSEEYTALTLEELAEFIGDPFVSAETKLEVLQELEIPMTTPTATYTVNPKYEIKRFYTVNPPYEIKPFTSFKSFGKDFSTGLSGYLKGFSTPAISKLFKSSQPQLAQASKRIENAVAKIKSLSGFAKNDSSAKEELAQAQKELAQAQNERLQITLDFTNKLDQVKSEAMRQASQSQTESERLQKEISNLQVKGIQSSESFNEQAQKLAAAQEAARRAEEALIRAEEAARASQAALQAEIASLQNQFNAAQLDLKGYETRTLELVKQNEQHIKTAQEKSRQAETALEQVDKLKTQNTQVTTQLTTLTQNYKQVTGQLTGQLTTAQSDLALAREQTAEAILRRFGSNIASGFNNIVNFVKTQLASLGTLGDSAYSYVFKLITGNDPSTPLLSDDKEKVIFGLIVSTVLVSIVSFSAFAILNAMSLKSRMKELTKLISKVSSKIDPESEDFQKIARMSDSMLACLSATTPKNKVGKIQCAIEFLNSGILDIVEQADPKAGAKLKNLAMDLNKRLIKSIRSI